MLVCVCGWQSVSPIHVCVFVVYSCFLPLCVCVASGVWWCRTCCVRKVGGGAECVSALAQHTFWWMLPLYGISVMFRQCDIAECVSGWSGDGKLKAKALCSEKVTRLLHTCVHVWCTKNIWYKSFFHNFMKGFHNWSVAERVNAIY